MLDFHTFGCQKDKTQKVRPCFFTKSVLLGRTELSICRICAESRDLQSEHGFEACSLKHKGKRLDFHTFGGQKSEKKTKIWTKSVKFWSPEVWMGGNGCGRLARTVF